MTKSKLIEVEGVTTTLHPYVIEVPAGWGPILTSSRFIRYAQWDRSKDFHPRSHNRSKGK